MTQFPPPPEPPAPPPSSAQPGSRARVRWTPRLRPEDVPTDRLPATRRDIGVVMDELRQICRILEDVRELLREQGSNP
jgi:hypothetical protein